MILKKRMYGTLLCVLFLACSESRCASPRKVSQNSRVENTSSEKFQIASEDLKEENMPRSDLIVVDQIGYRTKSKKWFMIKNPKVGYDSQKTYVPGKSVQIRRAKDSKVVAEIELKPWNNGEVDNTFSGDQVWQGEFSDVSIPGTYRVYDPKNEKSSYDFMIGDNIYNSILEASVKTYYYQRSNTAIETSHGKEWVHALDHTQQKSAQLYDHAKGGYQGETTEMDVTGGWFDAGDYGKYTAYMGTIIWELAHAYEWYSDRFTDKTGIPESGNGVPDIVDEIKVELDWLQKMQRKDGALFSGVYPIKDGNRNGGEGDPSRDKRPFGYANISTAATSSGATSFAIGARLFSEFKNAYPGYAEKLNLASQSAWAFLKSNPKNIQYDQTNFLKGGKVYEEDEDKRMRVLAAAELFRSTQKEEYRKYFEDNYNNPNTTHEEHQPIINKMFETGKALQLQQGLVSYCLAKGAKESIVKEIKTALKNGIEWNIINRLNECPYKAFVFPFHYHWGSNAVQANWANIVQYGIILDVNSERKAEYWETAEEHLHYLHGRNATGFCYLTQCQLFGAEKPITQIYHGWFHDGTKYDTNPAPGFLAGGPNRFFKSHHLVGKKQIPPEEQPPMKAYKDWNTAWPENSWSITENSTGYQSRHVLLTAAFAGSMEL